MFISMMSENEENADILEQQSTSALPKYHKYMMKYEYATLDK